MQARTQYISIIMVYWSLRIKSFSLSLLKAITAGMKGSRMMLIGKNVMVTEEKVLSKLAEFFNLMIFILLRASRFLYTNLYLLINMATRNDRSRILKMNTNRVMNTVPS